MKFYLFSALSFFSTLALADAQQAPDMTSQFVMMGAVFVFFYLVVIRPQSKKAKEHKEVITKLAKGDEVVTASGILGKIVEVHEGFISLTIADNVVVKIQKHMVSDVMPKGTLKSADKVS